MITRWKKWRTLRTWLRMWRQDIESVPMPEMSVLDEAIQEAGR